MTRATVEDWAIAVSAWALAAGWVFQLIRWLRNFPSLDDLNRMTLPALPAAGEGPQVTVVVPACNEEASIATTLESLLASEEIRLQIIAVNDRSTDRSGAIMQEISQAALDLKLILNMNNCLQVIHINNLPLNWLGKPHALAKGAALAQADWILFTDGDVTFAPKAIAQALRYALDREADHLVLMPDWTMNLPGEAAMHGAMHALSIWTLRLWRVAEPGTRDFLGVGAFNLVRRSTYEAVGGFEALRMEVLEDMRLGWLIKRAGYRQRVVLGPGLAAVRWAHGAWGVVANLEKNLFALYRFRTAMALFACLGLVVQIALPLLALCVGGWARIAALLQYAALAGLYVASRKVTRVPPGYVVLYPVAVTLFLFAHLRSLTMVWVRGGVRWRGTLYALKDLRAHAGRFW